MKSVNQKTRPKLKKSVKTTMTDLYKILKKADLEYSHKGNIYEETEVKRCFPVITRRGSKYVIRPYTIWEMCREVFCEFIPARCADTCWEDYVRYDIDDGAHFEFSKNYSAILMENAKYENMLSGLRVLHVYEKMGGLKKTYLRKLTNSHTLVVGSGHMHRSIPIMSLYLMLLKLISKYPIKKGEGYDSFLYRVSKNQPKSDYDVESDLHDLLYLNKNIISIVMKNAIKLNKTVCYSGYIDDYTDESELGAEGINKMSAVAFRQSSHYMEEPHEDFSEELNKLVQ